LFTAAEGIINHLSLSCAEVSSGFVFHSISERFAGGFSPLAISFQIPISTHLSCNHHMIRSLITGNFCQKFLYHNCFNLSKASHNSRDFNDNALFIQLVYLELSTIIHITFSNSLNLFSISDNGFFHISSLKLIKDLFIFSEISVVNGSVHLNFDIA